MSDSNRSGSLFAVILIVVIAGVIGYLWLRSQETAGATGSSSMT